DLRRSGQPGGCEEGDREDPAATAGGAAAGGVGPIIERGFETPEEKPCQSMNTGARLARTASRFCNGWGKAPTAWLARPAAPAKSKSSSRPSPPAPEPARPRPRPGAAAPLDAGPAFPEPPNLHGP